VKATFVKSEKGLVPCDEESQKLFDAVGFGELVMVEHVKTRDYNQHKRFFAFRNRSFEMQDFFDNDEVWRKQLHIMAGHFDTVIVPKPKWYLSCLKRFTKLLGASDPAVAMMESQPFTVLIAKSIAYDAMDEIEFEDFFSKAVHGFLDNYGNGISEEDFMDILKFERGR